MKASFSSSPEALQQQLSQLMAGMNSGSSIYGTSDYFAKQKQIADLQMRIQSGGAGGTAGAGGANDPYAEAQRKAQENQDRILADTEGRVDTVMNDPATMAAIQRLQGVMGGKDAPYNQEVRANMLSAASDSNAAAESAQAGMLRDQMAANGGNMADPASQSALRELMSRRQQGNASAANGIAQQANIANFNAAQDATKSLAGIRSGQLNMANQMALAGAGQRANFAQTVDQGTVPQQSFFQMPASGTIWGGGGSVAPDFNPTGARGGGVPAPAPRPQPQPTPAPTPYRTPVNRIPPSQLPGYVNSNMQPNTGLTPRGTGYVQMSGQPETRQYYQTQYPEQPAATNPYAPRPGYAPPGSTSYNPSAINRGPIRLFE